jgi:hypothetical protein
MAARVLTTQNPTGSQIEIPTTNIGTIVVEALDPAAASSTVLSNVLYADNGTAVPVPDQNGSINAPFGTLVAGIAGTPASGTLLVTPRNYAPEGTITIAQSITIASINPTVVSSILLQNLTINGGLVFAAQGIVVGGTTASPGGGVAVLYESQLGVVTGILNLTLYQQSVLTAATALASLTATESTIGANVTCSGSTVTLNLCSFSNGISITFSGGPGTLVMDATSYQNFVAASGVIVNGSIVSNSPTVPTLALRVPQQLNAAGGGGYTTLTQDGGAAFSFDATTLGTEKLEVGIDATDTDMTSGVHSELRANRSYVMIAGVLTQLNDSTAFSPAVVAGNPTLNISLAGNHVALQGYAEAAAGHNHRYVGSLFIKRVAVS